MTWNPNATVTIGGVDFTGETLGGLAIHYGRPTIWDQARASYATVSILNSTDTDYAFQINDDVVVEIQDSDGTDVTVFTGKVTDISNELAAAGSGATVAVQTLTAVGPFAQMARTIVGTTNYPKEYDDDRITRILTEAGVTIDVVDTPGVYELQERQSDPQDAYTLSTYYAGMCFGYMYETKAGAVGYANESRRTVDVNASGYLDIAEGYINWKGINSRKSISDIVNKIILFYKNGQSKTAEDTSSATNYGLIEARIDTELEDGDQAQNIADRYVSLRSVPETNFSSFNINLDNPNITAADLDDLINIEMGTAIQISDLPNAISSINYTGFVEGWDLVINQYQALLTITSSDSTYSVVPIRWQDVDPTIQWEDIDPSATRSTKTNLVRNPSFEPVDYGKLGYIYLPGGAGYFLTAPDESALDITGDIDIRVKVALDDWTPTNNNNLISKNDTNNYSYNFGIASGTPGTLFFSWTANGTTALNINSTVATGIADGSTKWVRVTFDVNNGAGGRTAIFYTSDDGMNWTQLGTTVTQAGTTSLFSGSGVLRIGSFSDTGTTTTKGNIYAASIRNGIDGTEVFQFDVGGNWKSTDIDSFTAQTGQTVSLSSLMTAYGWISGTVASGTLSRDTTQKYSGDTSLKFSISTTSSITLLLALANTTITRRIPCALNDVIWIQARVRQGSGSRTVTPRIFTYATSTTGTGVETFTGSAVTLDSTWKLVQFSATISNANSLFLTPAFLMGAGNNGDFVYYDAVIVEKNSGGYAAYYFDGSYSEIPADRDPKLAWTGTANDSTSTGNAYWGTKPTTLWQNVDTVGLP